MKNIAKFAVQYPITIVMLVLGILILGYISFQKLAIELLPDLNNPRIYIEVKAGEKPPEDMEQQYVVNIEAVASRQKKVVQVASTCRVGSAQIIVEYSWDADMDESFLDLQKALTAFTQNEEIDELTTTQHDPNASPVMLVGFSHPDISDMNDLRKTAENYLRNELIRLEGIAEVEILGQEEQEVVVETTPYMLDAYQLTPSNIVSKLQTFNRNVSGGSIVEMGRKYIIKGVSELQSLTDIENVIVTYKSADQQTGAQASAGSLFEDRVPVFLRDVAKVSLENKEPTNIVRVNGHRCLGLAMYKEARYNTVRAVEQLSERLAELQKSLPGYELIPVQNQAEFIHAAIGEVEQTALFGILLAVFVIFIFLRRVGVTFIISVAIPISIVATFNLMYFQDLTLNIMTLGGLALGAGMLVDNAIVVMENIFRNLELGMSVKDATIHGTAEVGTAITASTITTIIVFLPIVYLHGAASELFKDQAWTVALSLISSLFVAILVIPMLSSIFLHKYQQDSVNSSQAIHFSTYGKFLEHALHLRWFVLIGALALVAITIMLLPRVGSEFIPKTDQGMYTLKIKMPEGTDLALTARTVEQIEGSIYDTIGDDLATLYSKIGPSSEISTEETDVFEDENTASMHIVLKKDRQLSQYLFIAKMNSLLENIPDVEYQLVEEQTALQASFNSEIAPIVVEIKGEDLDELQSLTNQVKQQMLGIPDLTNIVTSFEQGRPQIDIHIDRMMAGLRNISIDQVALQLNDYLSGREIGEWDDQGELKDMTLRLPKLSISELEQVIIANGSEKIPLTDLARIEYSTAPREINRRNQSRIGKITAHVSGNVAFDHVVKRIENNLKDVEFPPAYRYTISGEEEQRRESFANLKFALILSIVLVYMVLASLFESMIHPFTIIFTIPLAAVGAIWLFFILGQPLNIMAYIGIIMLAGIAVNDSIILVDATNQLRKDGADRVAAIVEAGQRRIRPIIMTSLTTILALLPLTFGFGEGAALRAPMAFAVIGGLVTSTLLTLVVIPCVYYVLDSIPLRRDNS